MPRPKCAGARVAIEYAERHPHAGSRTLARMIVDERPDLFPAHMDHRQRVETARQWVRRVFGLAGSNSYTDTGHLWRPARQLVLSPPPADQLPSTDPVQLPPVSHAYILADIHIPYHHTQHLDYVIDQIRRDQPDLIVLLGDVLDCAILSRHAQYHAVSDVADELLQTEHLLESLRVAAPRAQIVWKHGNHEDRVRRRWSEIGMAADGADWLSDRIDVTGLGVTVVPAWVTAEMRLESGRVVLAHGHERSTSGAYPAARAWSRYGADARYVIIGHHHYIDRYVPPGTGRRCAAHVVGCMAQIPAYHAAERCRWMCGYMVLRDDRLIVIEMD